MSEQALIPVKGEQGLISFAPSGQFITSLDLKTDRGKYLYVMATNGDPVRLSEVIGETINVTDAFAHEVQIVKDEGGEVTTAVRLVVFDDSGRAFQCVSKGAWESLRRLTVIYGPLPWPDGNPVKVSQKPIGKKRMFFFDLPPMDTPRRVTTTKVKDDKGKDK